MYDLIIIGGGPAGAAAAVYAARKRLKSAIIAGEWGGQSNVSEGIENWIGTPTISGADLAKSFETHVKQYAGDIVDVKVPEWVKNISQSGNGFTVETDKGSYGTKTVLITSGSKRRRLEVPGADTFEHKGLTYCASCDGPLFAGQDTVVVGGGNAAFETAAQLLAYAKSVTLLNRSETLKADPVTIDEVKKHPNFKLVLNAQPKEIKGDKFVSSIVYTDTKENKDIELAAPGIFVEIGLIPATNITKDVVKLNDYGQIEIDPWNQRTSTLGIWAAGDCTNVKYHQNNIAAGDAVKALEDIYLFLKAGK
ncbi:MAG: pyridine nucleotide-disulfide oxidoreductase [Candidatus Zambryskibacteria bacterium CG10_big_fil_rev_8_21_14_0_10_42_12]|uniref:Pyridine nucleotide-disulfide oxidoreductase n=1 Tax=Candidatus Zambryskibacteria bacterium CG10_big_fil_rev_8_21_14_0_10_42_12 TaxID=1975115 RepID=A0A2H0QVA4_9BACT|nr:MAG: pyridine nucleotide-disulfide oxidoreductase [Candidatus Zambryskibacteria bacterium CG10_big_fil_rev_8_21_14_0_10_42_12]